MAKLKQQSLHKRENQLANSNRQLEILNGGIFENGELPTFAKKITQTNQFPLRPKKLEILQILHMGTSRIVKISTNYILKCS